MSRLIRFGVSLEKGLLEKFDYLLKKKNYTSRSESFRDLIRQELVKKEWQEGKEVAGAMILIYDHHKRELVNKMMNIQHSFSEIIISTQHIHLDHNNCLEIIAIRGSPNQAEKLSDRLRSVKKVKHVALTMSSTGKHIE